MFGMLPFGYTVGTSYDLDEGLGRDSSRCELAQKKLVFLCAWLAADLLNNCIGGGDGMPPTWARIYRSGQSGVPLLTWPGAGQLGSATQCELRGVCVLCNSLGCLGGGGAKGFSDECSCTEGMFT